METYNTILDSIQVMAQAEVDLCGHATLAASSVIFHQASKDFKNEDSSSGIERIIFHARKAISPDELKTCYISYNNFLVHLTNPTKFCIVL